jgi:hypothetical protein
MNDIILLNYLNNTTIDQYRSMNALCDLYKNKIIFGRKISNRVYKKRYIGENQFGLEITIITK